MRSLLRCMAALSLAALAGCAAMKGAEAPTVLRLSPTFDVATVAKPITVAVAPVQARGVTGDRRYAYVDRAAPGEIQQAATIFWEEAPTRIVERALVQGLRSRLGSATGPEVTAGADMRLVARLDRFEEMTGGSGPVVAMAALDVTAVADRRTVLAGRYCAQAPIASAQGTARAQAFEAALRDVVAHIAADLASGHASRSAC